MDWCRVNNLSVNVTKTKEMVVDRRAQTDHPPLYIACELVKHTKFFSVHLVENNTWSLNTSSIASLHSTEWLSSASFSDASLSGLEIASLQWTLHWIVRIDEKILRVSLPPITNIYNVGYIHKATSIVNEHMHPSNKLFTLFPSGKGYCSIWPSWPVSL